MGSNLVLHKGARRVELDELLAVPAPPGEGRWYPLSHGAVLRRVEETLGEAGYEVKREDLALSRGNARFFGTLDLSTQLADGVALSVGVRNSIDKSFPIGFVAGNRVFCCDNLAFRSDLISVRRKHTRYGEQRFATDIAAAMSSLDLFREGEAERIAAMQTTGVDDTLDQTISSIALARKLRKRLPAVMIAMGGYALEGPVAREVLRCFPWIDAVCLGEGEPAIVELALASAGQRPLAGIPNVLTRDTGKPQRVGPRYVRNLRLAVREPIPTRAGPISMDESPVPSFDDYFADLDELKRVHQVEIEFDTLPVETSRGCWWGQKNHCVFCGIDDETMQYRARSPANTIAMLDKLSQRYRVQSFRFSDYILPYTYFQTLLPALAARREPYHLECEIKANLTADHFKLLRSAGFGECQPGIESFSSSVLSKMCKGVTGIRNVQTLVLGKMNGVRIHYNFLFGFPTDELAEYEAMLTIIPLLYHLDPPHGRQQVEITRFAPLQADPERFGIRVAPHASLYDAIFSPGFLAESGFDLDAYAYYFERTYANSPALQRVYGLLTTQIDYWKTTQGRRTVELTWSGDDESITFRDSRYLEEATVSTFGARHHATFRACAVTARSIDEIAKLANLTTRGVATILEELIAARVVLREGRTCLGLAVPHADVPAEKQFQRKWVVA